MDRTEDPDYRRNLLAVRQWAAERYNTARAADALNTRTTIDIKAALEAANKRMQQAEAARSVWQRLWARIRGR